MADGTVYSAGDGAVTLQAANGVALGRIVTTGGAVGVTATTGNITDNTADNGAGNENIATTSGNVTLTATAGNIGATGVGLRSTLRWAAASRALRVPRGRGPTGSS